MIAEASIRSRGAVEDSLAFREALLSSVPSISNAHQKEKFPVMRFSLL
jgi:hypothetical protein